MRKIFILFVLLFISITSLFAQGKKRTGFKIGANYSFQRIEKDRETESSDARTGVSVGLFQEIPINNSIAFLPEISYNRMGGKFDDVVTKLDFISLPMLFRFHGKHVGLHVGPQFNLIVGAREKAQYTDEVKVKDKYKSADIAGVLGVDYSFAKDRFIVAARYMLGMNDVVKASGAGGSVHNHGIQLTAGFRFGK